MERPLLVTPASQKNCTVGFDQCIEKIAGSRFSITGILRRTNFALHENAWQQEHDHKLNGESILYLKDSKNLTEGA